MGVFITEAGSSKTDDQIASEVPFTPAQGISATETQAAIVEAVKKITIPIKEENVSSLKKGQVVCAVGASGEKVKVGLCDCTDPNKIRIMGLISTDLVQNAAGFSIFKGELPGIDSRATNLDINPNSETWAEGAMLWAADTAGGMTHTRPMHGRSIKAAISRKGSCADDILQVISHENPINVMAAVGEDIILGMGDSAGVNKVSYKDYGGNEVASIDSDGKQTLKGITTETKTDSYTIVAADIGKCLRMNSAIDKIFTFPSVGASDDGAILNFENINTGKLTLQMVDLDKIHDSGATCTIYTNDDSTATLSVRYCHATVTWLIINGLGTWVTTN